jgi:hypothetical protein
VGAAIRGKLRELGKKLGLGRRRGHEKQWIEIFPAMPIPDYRGFVPEAQPASLLPLFAEIAKYKDAVLDVVILRGEDGKIRYYLGGRPQVVRMMEGLLHAKGLEVQSAPVPRVGPTAVRLEAAKDPIYPLMEHVDKPRIDPSMHLFSALTEGYGGVAVRLKVDPFVKKWIASWKARVHATNPKKLEQKRAERARLAEMRTAFPLLSCELRVFGDENQIERIASSLPAESNYLKIYGPCPPEECIEGERVYSVNSWTFRSTARRMGLAFLFVLWLLSAKLLASPFLFGIYSSLYLAGLVYLALRTRVPKPIVLSVNEFAFIFSFPTAPQYFPLEFSRSPFMPRTLER